jgi:hypothetical protein
MPRRWLARNLHYVRAALANPEYATTIAFGLLITPPQCQVTGLHHYSRLKHSTHHNVYSHKQVHILYLAGCAGCSINRGGKHMANSSFCKQFLLQTVPFANSSLYKTPHTDIHLQQLIAPADTTQTLSETPET